MPLSGTGNQLGDLIKSLVDLEIAGLSDDDKRNPSIVRTTYFRAIGSAIIQHLLNNGNNAVLVPFVTGVTTGAGTSGSGTGNLT